MCKHEWAAVSGEHPHNDGPIRTDYRCKLCPDRMSQFHYETKEEKELIAGLADGLKNDEFDVDDIFAVMFGEKGGK